MAAHAGARRARDLPPRIAHKSGRGGPPPRPEPHGALDIFARYHGHALASLARLSAEGRLRPGLALGSFTAAPSRTGADIVVDAALVHARGASSPGHGRLDLARSLAGDLAAIPATGSVALSGPGLVEVTLRPAAVFGEVASLLRAGAAVEPLGADPASGEAGLGATLDEARARVAMEQAEALAAAGGRVAPHGSRPRTVGRVVVGGQGAGACREGVLAGIDRDAFRFAVAACRPDAPLHLDLPALSERSRDRPWFWVPYAHARFRGVLRRARDAMPDLDLAPRALAEADLLKLRDPGELALARLLIRYPHVIATATAPHRLAVHLRDVAAAVHSQWNRSKDQPQLRFVNEEERDLAKARLALVTASTLVLQSGLGILGVTAPDEMR